MKLRGSHTKTESPIKFDCFNFSMNDGQMFPKPVGLPVNSPANTSLLESNNVRAFDLVIDGMED